MANQIGVSQQIHPLEQLVGGPLQAIIEAHALLSQSALKFFSDFGFEPVAIEKKTAASSDQANGAPLAKLRTLEFSYIHPVPDSEQPGNIIDTPTHVKIPLLAMLSLPSLTISEATLDFNIKVVGFTQTKEAIKKSDITKAKLPFAIQGAYASRSPAADESTPETSTIAISIKMKQEPVPEGAKKLMNLLQDALIATPLKQ